MRSAKNMNVFNSFNVPKESEACCVNGINHINQEIMGTVPGNSDTAMRNADEVSSNCTDKFFLCWWWSTALYPHESSSYFWKFLEAAICVPTNTQVCPSVLLSGEVLTGLRVLTAKPLEDPLAVPASWEHWIPTAGLRASRHLGRLCWTEPKGGRICPSTQRGPWRTVGRESSPSGTVIL